MRKLALILLLCFSYSTLAADEQCDAAHERCIDQCPATDSLSLPACEDFCRRIPCAEKRTAPHSVPAPDSQRGDWVVGASSSRSGTGFALPRCTDDDTAGCKENCQREFDIKPPDCLAQCLRTKCVQDDTFGTGPENGSTELADMCVDFESADCVQSCENESGSAQLRCRRTCLMQACPKASALVIAEDALQPGRARCISCKQDAYQLCRGLCVPTPRQAVSGLATAGCIELCQRTRCDCW